MLLIEHCNFCFRRSAVFKSYLLIPDKETQSDPEANYKVKKKTPQFSITIASPTPPGSLMMLKSITSLAYKLKGCVPNFELLKVFLPSLCYFLSSSALTPHIGSLQPFTPRRTSFSISPNRKIAQVALAILTTNH